MHLVHITIKNWEKHNSPTDLVRHPFWFKIHNKIMSSESLYNLTPAQKWFWLCLLCECCRKKSKTVAIDLDFLGHYSCVPKMDCLQALEILKQNGTVTYDCTMDCQQIVSPLTENRQPNRIEKNRIEKSRKENTIGQNEFDHESLYFLYPRKIKKKKGFEKLRLLIKTKDDFERVKKSILNYSDYCSKYINESRYIMHFSTFMSSWEDWLEPKTESVKTAIQIGPKPLSSPAGIPDELNRPDPRIGPLDPSVKKLLDQALGKL